MRVLFINDGSLTNPVVSSQGLPQLFRLAERGYEIYFLSVETRGGASYWDEYYRIVRKYGGRIRILRLRGLPESLIRPQMQLLLIGPLAILYYILRFKIECVHARSYVPGILALWAKKLLGVRFLFDMRGLFVDEFISKGAGKEGSATIRILRYLERACILRADAIVVVSDAFRRHLLDLPYANPHLPIETIPCCVDLDRFELDPAAIGSLRKEHGFDGRTVIVYSGSLASWQLASAAFRFFRFCAEERRNSHLLILTYSDPAGVLAMLDDHRISAGDVTIQRAGFDDVPKFLALADAGLLLRNDEPLNRVASPLKFAEYLAAGVPVVLTKGIGDTEEIVKSNRIGIVVDSLSDEHLLGAAGQLFECVNNRRAEVAALCRAAARSHFSLDESVEKYFGVYATLRGKG